MAQLSKDQLLELHPWPEEHAKAKKIERMWTFDLPGKPAELWPFISDTSRLNRALGLSEMTFTEKAGKRYGASKPGGVRHEWYEVPWSWVAEQWLTSTRVYERGFMKVSFAVHRLEPSETGTRVYLYYGVVPRGAFGAMCIRIGFPTLERAYKRVLPELAAQLDRLRPPVLELPPPALSEESRARLDAAAAQLKAEGLPAKCIDALVDFVRKGDDIDLHRIQIRERARTWKLDEEDLLRTALHATRAGILDLSWDTICPHCRGMREETGKLSELHAEAHCEVCAVDFATDKIEAIEVTFRVHPSVRDVPEQLYCSAEPSTKDHVRVQTMVAPGETVTLHPKLPAGRYCVFVDHAGGWYLDVDSEGASELTWKEQKEGAAVRVAPDPKLVYANPNKEPAQLLIERATWSDDALRPGHLLSLQEFRDLFSEDYIGADVKLAVGEQTILFTDVVGSTAFYALRGDPAAFVEIKKHFDEVFAIVRERRGAVVKTIGDAVMATFGHPVDALRASRAIHDCFHPKREDTPIRLRISLNTGPCIAVRLNSNADFFGGTVNIAAKLQALAEGHQIAMSEVTYRGSGVAEYLAEVNAKIEEMTYESKALREPVSVRRWTVYP